MNMKTKILAFSLSTFMFFGCTSVRADNVEQLNRQIADAENRLRVAEKNERAMHNELEKRRNHEGALSSEYLRLVEELQQAQAHLDQLVKIQKEINEYIAKQKKETAIAYELARKQQDRIDQAQILAVRKDKQRMFELEKMAESERKKFDNSIAEKDNTEEALYKELKNKKLIAAKNELFKAKKIYESKSFISSNDGKTTGELFFVSVP
ncbi:hypothetical protein FACS189465_0880 [Clostridia bacterium]|nr:hypothetical protein FACS189465_0880 [Clostridia bacterium]